MIAYPVQITPDGEQFLVRFPDVPEAITFGETEGEAVVRARDALESALTTYVEAGKALPRPTGNAAESSFIAVSALAEAKLTLHSLLLERGLSVGDLANRLGSTLQSAKRLLDVRVESSLGEIEQAFQALDRRLTIQVVDAA
ncbi:MAG: type II toxin-antitoxin system HicB family antitoxin [Bryobacterales bacterium]|nr:type II toxin-antitoxin system HicB family antitoxin [Acidobacteriota bacterium]MCB9386094.1 type II toxin-antitoxin system HicB family antitoxin [Bryobacterales bacterium]